MQILRPTAVGVGPYDLCLNKPSGGSDTYLKLGPTAPEGGRALRQKILGLRTNGAVLQIHSGDRNKLVLYSAILGVIL